MRNEKLYERLSKLHNMTFDILCPDIVENVEGCIDALREECTNMVAYMTSVELIDMVENLYQGYTE